MTRFTLLLAFMIPLFIHAQGKKMDKATAEKEVTEKINLLTKAMVDADEQLLSQLASDKLVYGHSLGAVEDKAAFVRNIVNGNSDFVTIDITEQTIMISGNVAIVRHKLHAKTADKGKQPGEVRLVIMQTWQKQKKDNDWKMIGRQAVRPPQQ